MNYSEAVPALIEVQPVQDHASSLCLSRVYFLSGPSSISWLLHTVIPMAVGCPQCPSLILKVLAGKSQRLWGKRGWRVAGLLGNG